jgi:hypothetical protein
MKKTILTLMTLISLCGAFMLPTDFPSVKITNGLITAKLLLPDANKGYYRGTRFDWSGVIPSLEYKGHNYFGVWNPAKYDPKLHDAITGPFFYFKIYRICPLLPVICQCPKAMGILPMAFNWSKKSFK